MALTVTALTSCPEAKFAGVGFTIGTKVYFTTGANAGGHSVSTWCYDTVAGTWSQKADYTGAARKYTFGGAVAGKGYCGGGTDTTNNYSDWREYDPTGNAWTNKNSLVLGQRWLGISAVYDGHLYVGFGSSFGGTRHGDLYRYNESDDTWTAMASVGSGREVQYASAFVIGAYLYVCFGYDTSGYVGYVDRYSFAGNSWTNLASQAGLMRGLGAGFSDGTHGYIFGGINGTAIGDIQQYTPTGDAWAKDQDYSPATYGAMVAMVGSTAYAFGGYTTGYVATLHSLTNIVPPTGDWAYTVSSGRVLLVTAADIEPPAGLTITGYAWDFGDDGTGTGVVAAHVYAEPGVYTVTLTVTLSDDSTFDFEKEISMATITGVTPKRAQRAETVTIAGSGFGASQSTGTVTVGGKALTDITWGATSIVGKLATDCPYGSQDVVVTPAGGSAVTLEKGVYCYSATLLNDADSVKFQKLKKVFLDGLHVGFTKGGAKFTQKTNTDTFVPDDGYEAVKAQTEVTERMLEVTFSQLDGALMAAILSGTYDGTAKVISLPSNAVAAEHSLAIEGVDGTYMIYKKCLIMGDQAIELNNNWNGIATQWKVLRLDDPDLSVVDIYLP